MRAAIYTLGCKVNQYESQAMEKLLARRGAEIVDFESGADLIIVNTCSVTAESDRKSRQVIRRARRLNPAAVVAVCGCFSQTHREQAESLGADVVFGTNEKEKFIDLLLARAPGETPVSDVDDVFRHRAFEDLPAGGLSGRTRAMLKVQDGCANFCTYCIIPYARGPVRSLPLKRAVEETEKLRARGYRELVVTGIEISSYGLDLRDGTDLVTLTKALAAAAPDMRIHLGSLEPRTVDGRFCRELREIPNLCPHFHLSMQSGCDSVLMRMGRRYDTARYLESVRLLRESFPGCAVTTDMIVGFPGETEAEFAESLAFLETCQFADMHIFPYSRREGTKAAAMPDQVEKNIKKERVTRASVVASTMKKSYLERQVGKTFDVLFESFSEGLALGHTPNYAEVLAPSPVSLHGEVRSVHITGTDGERLRGEIDKPAAGG